MFGVLIEFTYLENNGDIVHPQIYSVHVTVYYLEYLIKSKDALGYLGIKATKHIESLIELVDPDGSQ